MIDEITKVNDSKVYKLDGIKLKAEVKYNIEGAKEVVIKSYEVDKKG